MDEPVAKERKVWQGISHGFHVIERGDETQDLILAQREQADDLELWLFGAFDTNVGYPIRKYLQSNIFSNKVNETVHEGDKHEDGGFTTALVMNAEKIVVASFGGYKAVLCRGDVAIQLGKKHRRVQKGFWSLLGAFHLKYLTENGKKSRKNTRLGVSTHKVEPEFEFIVLASDGIWEVMSNQEAVNLISHIEDAQTAAEVLALEAVTRMSKSTISCAVVRFH
ncbi:putative protein phosphatase 2C-like protein 44 [Asparagus officinalis]|uniref:putative protein phosphatase 2C-like protein 44 n=1 Tax=Asparagus officinalis TaxID=4686 RepID=UPI00098E0191|nr:putative protein phosphatase 2C-like protein 44 [Asparagus officinalis]